ncbi:cortactin-binding protein 2 [Trichoderma asperellum]|uniref:Cortactin-binding protein 2 n=1 Tax=Trichoderma asperellum TaxID=101201 RepID=A0A6V8QP17_TRIAP|nr:cortactin-binding protein 2 [Trichoderma asperellum]
MARIKGQEAEKEADPDPDLAAVLKRFLGSPSERSASFRRWTWRGYEDGHIPTALSAMCKYGFYYTLRGWWTQPGRITAEVALKGGGFDALWIAAKGHCMPICRHLVKLIEAVHPKGDTYYTFALATSIEENNFDMVKFLVTEVDTDVDLMQQGPLLNYDYLMGGTTTAVQTAARRQPRMLQWMMDQGVVDLESETNSRCTNGSVLIAAAAWGNIKSVQILLKAGANVDAAVHNGKYGSALVAAVAADRIPGERAEVVQLLLSHGADPNMPMRGGQWGSALEASVARDWETELGPKYSEGRRTILLLLLEAGADPTVVYDYGSFGSALTAAAFWGQKEDLKTMIGRVGAERAIEALRQSRHPDVRGFEDQQDITRWKETATYLAEEVGVSKDILHTIGIWDVEPEPCELWEFGAAYNFVLRYSEHC